MTSRTAIKKIPNPIQVVQNDGFIVYKIINFKLYKMRLKSLKSFFKVNFSLVAASGVGIPASRQKMYLK